MVLSLELSFIAALEARCKPTTDCVWASSPIQLKVIGAERSFYSPLRVPGCVADHHVDQGYAASNGFKIFRSLRPFG